MMEAKLLIQHNFTHDEKKALKSTYARGEEADHIREVRSRTHSKNWRRNAHA